VRRIGTFYTRRHRSTAGLKILHDAFHGRSVVNFGRHDTPRNSAINGLFDSQRAHRLAVDEIWTPRPDAP
jgi:hypothetical protein